MLILVGMSLSGTCKTYLTPALYLESSPATARDIGQVQRQLSASADLFDHLNHLVDPVAAQRDRGRVRRHA